MQGRPAAPLITEELRIVDKDGKARIILSVSDGAPTIVISGRNETPGITINLDDSDRPSIVLSDPDPSHPTAALQIDDKGAHVKFDRVGGGSSYLFLNNRGISGAVLIDADGQRRSSIILSAEGELSFEQPDKIG